MHMLAHYLDFGLREMRRAGKKTTGMCRKRGDGMGGGLITRRKRRMREGEKKDGEVEVEGK